ncbi:MAG: hypothetical protein R3B71_06175 [Candidatus Gracilibacteria bacterium]
MKKFQKFGKYFLVFAIIFLFGWESASYYILKGSAESGIDQEEISPVAAFSSLIARLMAPKRTGRFLGCVGLAGGKLYGGPRAG